MQSILARLPGLSAKELEIIIATATQLLDGKGGPSNAPASPLAGLVFDAIARALGSPATLGIMPLALQKHLIKRVPELTLLFDTCFPGWNRNKTVQINFLRYMMALLRDDLIELKFKPSPQAMIHNIHRLGDVIDNAFPNYRLFKLGPLLVRKMQRDKTPKKNREN
jgi:hypothetical protein